MQILQQESLTFHCWEGLWYPSACQKKDPCIPSVAVSLWSVSFSLRWHHSATSPETTQKPLGFHVCCPGLCFPTGGEQRCFMRSCWDLPRLHRGRAVAQGGPAKGGGAGCEARWWHSPREASGQKHGEEESESLKSQYEMSRTLHLFFFYFPRSGGWEVVQEKQYLPCFYFLMG